MVPALTPVRSESSDIFRSSAAHARARTSACAVSASALALPTPAFMRVRGSCAKARRLLADRRWRARRTRRGALGDHLADLLLREARGEQCLFRVLAERRPGQAVVAPGRARQLHRNAEQAHRALGARLVDLDDHLAFAHELRRERLVELEQRLQT